MTGISYGRAMRRPVALLAIALVPFGSILAPRLARAQAPAELVRNIAYNYIDAYGGGSHPSSIVRVGNIVYFLATTPDTGTELWRSNGSPNGTVLVKDLVPGPGSSGIYNLTNVNGTLYFTNSDATAGNELWKSDGTAAGTARVKDIEPGIGSSNPSYFTNVDGTLFFVANTTNEGTELWKSDGTEAGTVLVKDAAPGPDSSSFSGVFVAVGDRLFFGAYTAAEGYELWTSDGTDIGTALLKDIMPGAGASNPGYLASSGGALFFQASDDVNGAELWRSDGTAAGTVLVKDINPGIDASYPYYLTDVGGTVFFSAYNNGYYSLWKSDGTEAGTVVVKPGVLMSYATKLGGTLLFANGGLWRSDGTEAGTIQFSTIPPQSAFVTNNNGLAFFVANDGSSGLEVWRTNGTAAGTYRTADIWGGIGGSNPTSLTAAGGNVFFSANDFYHAYELWTTNGTGAALVKDIVNDKYGSSPGEFIEFGGKALFSAFDSNGREVWRSDGTYDGTYLVSDVNYPNTPYGGPSAYTKVGSQVFFVGGDSFTRRLWKTDGTYAGTTLIKDISVTATGLFGGSGPVFSGDIGGGTVLFQSYGSGFELYRTDGTDAGTVLVKDICPGTCSSYPIGFLTIGSTVFFQARDANLTTDVELWKSDGTSVGTVRVKDIRPGFSGSSPTEFVNFGGTLFFQAVGPEGSELWKSDGSEIGTVLVKDIAPGSSSSPTGLTVSGGKLFFAASDLTGGRELWLSDGSEIGTVLVKDINPGGQSSDPNSFVDVAGILYFVANDGATGAELWRSDGTALGTELVKDIYPGATSSSPVNLTNINGQLFFSATDPDGGLELWKSDGTSAGTARLADTFTGPASSFPTRPVNVNGDLLFGARERTLSNELFKIAHGATCGDGTLDAGEGCDDGNNVNGDGCDISCTATGCGNGIVSAGEECDDGNDDASDFCTPDCKINTCGDGYKSFLYEGCDDGNAIDGDGCDNNCLSTSCGNGVVNPGEQCDLGPANGEASGCTTGCLIAGNGMIGPGEECDDGNLIDGDGCDHDGQIETCWTCTGEPSVCTRPDGLPCSDGLYCNGNDTCLAGACTVHGTDPCTGAGCSCDEGFDTCVCPCGDGYVDSGLGEVCDDGNTDEGDCCSSTCQPINEGAECDSSSASACSPAGSCSSGACAPGPSACSCSVPHPGPGCVEGACQACVAAAGYGYCTQPGYDWDSNCVNVVYSTCLASCTSVGCGDFTRGPNEECEDHNGMPGDCCDGLCQLEAECTESFKYYGASTAKGASAFTSRTVTLADLFGGPLSVDLSKPDGLSPVVAIDGGSVFDPTANYECYKAKDSAAIFGGGTYANALQTVTALPGKLGKVCYPSSRDGVPTDITRDALRCYKAKPAKGTPLIGDVTLDDDIETKVTTVGKLAAVCMSADQTYAGIEQPWRALICYKIKDSKSVVQSKFSATNADVDNVFGHETLTAKKARMLCLGSVLTY